MKKIITLFAAFFLFFFSLQAQDKKERKVFEKGTLLVSTEGVFDDVTYEASKEPYDALVIGIATGNQAPKKISDLISTEGVTYIKYNSENGPIKKGDLITSSSEPGAGMKATKSGTIIGIALEDAPSASGLIKIRILIQYVKQ